MQRFTNLLDAIAAAQAAGFTHCRHSEQAVGGNQQAAAEAFTLDETAYIWRHGGGPTVIEGSNEKIEAEISGEELPLAEAYALEGDLITCEGVPLYHLLKGGEQ